VAWCGVPVSYRRAPRISPPTLTPDLQYFAYGILTLALELRDANRGRGENKRFNADEAFRVAPRPSNRLSARQNRVVLPIRVE